MKEREWSDNVCSIVHSHFDFLETTRHWTFSTGGAASELVLRYSSDRITVAITISPMELPFLTLKTNESDGVDRSVRFAASGDPAAAKCAKKVYADVESGRFQWPSNKIHPLIDEYVTIQGKAVRKGLAEGPGLPKQRQTWKAV
jgi:hypothetical protein